MAFLEEREHPTPLRPEDFTTRAVVRAQILRILHDFGAPTFDQDLMGYLWQTDQTKLPE